MNTLPEVTFKTYSITHKVYVPRNREEEEQSISGSFNEHEDLAQLSEFMKYTPRHKIMEIVFHFTLDGYEDYDSFIVFEPNRNLGDTYIYFICDYIDIPHELLGHTDKETYEILDLFKLHVIKSLFHFFVESEFPDVIETLVKHLKIHTKDYYHAVSPHIQHEWSVVTD
jgi:hypothetical protein